MAKASNLELYEGELYGVYQKLWVITSENGNFFEAEPHCMIWANVSGVELPDLKESKLKQIMNSRHAYITSEMRKVKEIDPYTGIDKMEVKPVFPKGIPMWDFNNPIAKKEINGTTYRITQEGIFEKGVNQFSLYKEKKMVGNFNSVDLAKAYVERDASASKNNEISM